MYIMLAMEVLYTLCPLISRKSNSRLRTIEFPRLWGSLGVEEEAEAMTSAVEGVSNGEWLHSEGWPA
jgi:hypothetical protein